MKKKKIDLKEKKTVWKTITIHNVFVSIISHAF
jgi:hypothetical protein